MKSEHYLKMRASHSAAIKTTFEIVQLDKLQISRRRNHIEEHKKISFITLVTSFATLTVWATFGLDKCK